ncbi:polyprotein [Gilthead seabream picornavirus]|nr:polyprotein [Gilthead seabream picornavirus]
MALNVISKLAKPAMELLADPATEQATTSSDRVGGTVSVNATSASQAVSRTKHGFYPPESTHDDFWSQSTKENTGAVNPSKLIELASGAWTSNNTEGHRLLQVELPKGFYPDGTFPARGATRYFAAMRVSFDFEIQVNVAVGACGGIIVVYVPSGTNLTKRTFRTYPLLTSEIINVGANTTGKLHVPYTHFKNYVGMDTADLGYLEVYVWCQLTVPTGTPNDVTVNVYGNMNQMDMQCPRLVAQGPTRKKIDIAEGPGTMNLSTAKYTRLAQTVALCNESVAVDAKTAGAKHAVRSVKELLQVPIPLIQSERASISTAWNNSSGKGTIVYELSLGLQNMSNMGDYMANCFHYGRGSLIFKVSVFNSTLHKGRIRVAFFPVSDNTAPVAFTEKQANNAYYSILDIGLNSDITLTIPFTNLTWLKETNEWLGRFQIFVNSRLSVTDATAPNVRFIPYVSFGPDFEYVVPFTRNVQFQNGDGEDEDVPLKDFGEKEGLHDGSVEATGEDAAIAAGMGSPEERDDKGKNGAVPKALNIVTKTVNVVRSNHMSFQQLFGRAQYVGKYTLTAQSTYNFAVPAPTDGYMSLLRLFRYWTGDLNVHVYNDTNDLLELSHSYPNPGTPTESRISVAGAVVIPAKTSMSITVPWYFGDPLKDPDSDDAFGYLLAYAGGAGSMRVWISFQTINLFYPLPTPRRATLRSYLLRASNTQMITEATQTACDMLSARCGPEEQLQPPRKTKQPSILDMIRLTLAEDGEEEEDQWVRDLTFEGVEPNPGPVAQLVYKTRGLYRHYGVAFNNQVLHMSSDNILDAAITGKVPMVLTEDDGSWKVEEQIDVSAARLAAIERSKTMVHNFSATNNCETWAKEALGIDTITQPRALAIFGLIIAASTGVVAMGETGVADAIKKGVGAVTGGISDAAAFVKQKVCTFFREELLSSIKCDIIKTVFKLILRTVCYGVLFCSSPGLLTGACVATLIAMDLSGVQGLSDCTRTLLNAILEGDLMGMAGSMSELIYANNPDKAELVRLSSQEFSKFVGQSAGSLEGVRDFNDVTNAAKGIEWWLDRLQKFWEWVKSFFVANDQDDIRRWFDENKDEVLNTMTAGDVALMESTKAGVTRTPEFQKSVRDTMERLAALKALAIKGQVTFLITPISMMLAKLQSIHQPMSIGDGKMRVEPIGIWISGSAGAGKSTLAYSLMMAVAEILEKRGLEPKSLFSQPTASEYYDGYNQQFFHIIDDMGQDREENDLKLLCQTISSVPFTVPMADVTEKGMRYTSKIVIATTNKEDFSNKVLSCQAALERRFNYKFWMRPTKAYQKVNGRLDVGKANDADVLEKGHCWEISTSGTTGYYNVLDMKTVASEIADDLMSRLRIVEKLNIKLADFSASGVTFDPAPTMLNIDHLVSDVCPRKNKPTQEGDPDSSDEEEFKGLDSVWSSFNWNNTQPIDMGSTKDIPWQVTASKLVVTGEDSPFESLRRPKVTVKMHKVTTAVREWFEKQWTSWNKWFEKHKDTIIGIGIVSGCITGVASIYGAYCLLRVHSQTGALKLAVDNFVETKRKGFIQPGEDLEPLPGEIVNVVQRAYNGPAKMRAKNKTVPRPKQEGGNFNPQEYAHLHKSCVVMYPTKGKPYYGIAVGGHRILTYKHQFTTGGDLAGLIWNGLRVTIEEGSYQLTTITETGSDGVVMETDMILIDMPRLPFQMTSATPHISKPQKSARGAIIYGGVVNHSLGVTDIKPVYHYDVDDYAGKPHHYYAGIRYETKSAFGMCGGAIIQKQGGTWRIIGLHHAGDKVMYGTSINIQSLIGTDCLEGVVEDRRKSGLNVYCPSKTRLEESILHGIVETKMSPAPLHPNDPRLEVEIADLVKKAADKYNNDVFNPDPEAFAIAQMVVTNNLFGVTGHCKEWNIGQALTGDGENPIDLTTSPGKKYTDQKLTKRDLVEKHGPIIVPTDKFSDDVSDLYCDIKGDQNEMVYFAATLKDELRKNERVKQGKTRCIEACPFDYTVVHRMIMGPIYQKIYDAEPVRTGIAVGCNPFLDYHDIYHQMHEHWYTVDYSTFDGSIPEGLMRAAVEVLASCHEDPEAVRRVMEPVVVSRHLVRDEEWVVRGGMPSGSPCTSVLNSVCNLLVIYSTLLECGLDTITGNAMVITYGDDVLMSTTVPIHDELMPSVIFKRYGMVATSADKTSTQLAVDPTTATFLKRKFGYFPHTRYVTGVLDLESMLQKIQWCHGFDEFKQQFDSFTLELVLHGQETYDAVLALARPRLSKYKIFAPSFKQRLAMVYRLLFNN